MYNAGYAQFYDIPQSKFRHLLDGTLEIQGDLINLGDNEIGLTANIIFSGDEVQHVKSINGGSFDLRKVTLNSHGVDFSDANANIRFNSDNYYVRRNSENDIVYGTPKTDGYLLEPIASDFICTLPTYLDFDGQKKVATVTVRPYILGMGNVTVKYYKDGNEVSPIDAGTYTVKINVKEGANFTAASDIEVGMFTINKVDSGVKSVPTAKALIYTGAPQALIDTSSVEVTGGEMQYSLERNGEYSTVIPTGTDAGDYTVWYKVVGDANHNDIEPANIAVNIAKAELTIIANSYTIDAGDALPVFEYDVADLVNGEALPIDVIVTCSASDSILAGSYDIIVSGVAESTNYTCSYVNGILTVVGLTTPEITDISEVDGSVQLTWTKVDNATSYRVYRADTATGAKSLLKAVTTTSYTDATVEAGKAYYYFVKAYNTNTGELTEYSAYEMIELPAEFTAPEITDISEVDGSVQLTWTKVDNATSYRVYRANTATGAKSLLKAVTTTSYTDATAEAGKIYYYFVKAYNTNTGELTEYSAYEMIELPKFEAPVITSASRSDNKVTLTWTEVDDATSYRVYRANSATGAKSLLKAVTGTSYTDATVTAGNSYYYFVKAYNTRTGELTEYSAYEMIVLA